MAALSGLFRLLGLPTHRRISRGCYRPPTFRFRGCPPPPASGSSVLCPPNCPELPPNCRPGRASGGADAPRAGGPHHHGPAAGLTRRGAGRWARRGRVFGIFGERRERAVYPFCLTRLIRTLPSVLARPAPGREDSTWPTFPIA
jgi:hypothetical protein